METRAGQDQTNHRLNRSEGARCADAQNDAKGC